MEEEFNMHCKYGSSNRFTLIKNEQNRRESNMETPMLYGKHLYVNKIGNEAMHKK